MLPLRRGSIVVEELYEPSFNSISHEGIDDVFAPNDVGDWIAVLKPFLKTERPSPNSQE